ncbi:hypothetical protein D3C72_1753540 [compost metagenome]
MLFSNMTLLELWNFVHEIVTSVDPFFTLSSRSDIRDRSMWSTHTSRLPLATFTACVRRVRRPSIVRCVRMTFWLPYTPSPSSINVTRLPRPSIVMFDGTRSCDSRTMVMSDAKRIHVGPFLACASAARNVPGPAS